MPGGLAAAGPLGGLLDGERPAAPGRQRIAMAVEAGVQSPAAGPHLGAPCRQVVVARAQGSWSQRARAVRGGTRRERAIHDPPARVRQLGMVLAQAGEQAAATGREGGAPG